MDAAIYHSGALMHNLFSVSPGGIDPFPWVDSHPQLLHKNASLLLVNA
jgi:hypothetical protein